MMTNSTSRPILFVPELTTLTVGNWSSVSSSSSNHSASSFDRQADTSPTLDNMDHLSPPMLSADNRSWYQSILEDFLTSGCSKATNADVLQQHMCTFYSIGFIEQKVILVAIFGSLLSFSGVVQNALLFYLYLSREKFRQSNMVFLGLAAIFDVVVDASYIFLMTVSVLYEYYHSLALSRLWHSYVRTINAASQTSMTASSFLLVSATMERYRVSMNWRFKGFTGVTRITIAGVAMSAACILQTITYFELEVHYKPHCENSTEILSAYSMTQSCLAQIPAYANIFQFWIRKLATICFPFVLLCYFNLAIIIKLRQQQPEETDLHSAMLTIAYGKGNTDEHKLQKNRATRTMVIVATSYLIVHSLNFFLASWEMIDKQTLYQKHFKFYSFAADACSILAIFGNVIRLPIYLTSDNDIRKEFVALFQCCCSCARLEPPSKPTKGEDGQDLSVDDEQKEWRQQAEKEERQAAQLRQRLTDIESGKRLQQAADNPQTAEISNNIYAADSSTSSKDDGNDDDIITSITPLENDDQQQKRRFDDDMKRHQKGPSTNNYDHNETTIRTTRIANESSASPTLHYTTTTPNSFRHHEEEQQIHHRFQAAVVKQQKKEELQQNFEIPLQQQIGSNGIVIDRKNRSSHLTPDACSNDSSNSYSFNHFGPQPFHRNRLPLKQNPSGGGKKSNFTRKFSIGKGGGKLQTPHGKSASSSSKKPLILLPLSTNSAHYHHYQSSSRKHRSFSNNFGYPIHNNGGGSYDALLMMAEDLAETNNDLIRPHQPISSFPPVIPPAKEAPVGSGDLEPPIQSSRVTFTPSRQGEEQQQTGNNKQPRSWLSNLFLSRPSLRNKDRERAVDESSVRLESESRHMTTSRSSNEDEDRSSTTVTNEQQQQHAACSSRRSFPPPFYSSSDYPSKSTITRYIPDRNLHQGHSAPRRAQSSGSFSGSAAVRTRRFNRYVTGGLHALTHGSNNRKHCNIANNSNGGSANLLDPSTAVYESDGDSNNCAHKYFLHGAGGCGGIVGNRQYLNGYLPSHLARKFVNSNYSISDL